MTFAPAWRPTPDAPHTQVPERFPGEAWVGEVAWVAADAAVEGLLDEAFAGGVDGVVGCLGAPNEFAPRRLLLPYRPLLPYRALCPQLSTMNIQLYTQRTPAWHALVKARRRCWDPNSYPTPHPNQAHPRCCRCARTHGTAAHGATRVERRMRR